MYADPSFIREHVVKLRLNENVVALIGAAARKSGICVAEYARVTALRLVRVELGSFAMTGLC